MNKNPVPKAQSLSEPLITVDKIKAFNPCTDRFNNFTSQTPNFSGDLVDFLSLDHITYADKIWACIRLIPRDTLVKWSIACAESVLPIYLKRYPGNHQLPALFDYLGQIENFNNLTEAQRTAIITGRNAANTAANAANTAAADASAYASVYAVYAVYAAADAAYAAEAATYAAADAAAPADAAAYIAGHAASASDASAAEEQRNLNLLLLCSLMEDK